MAHAITLRLPRVTRLVLSREAGGSFFRCLQQSIHGDAIQNPPTAGSRPWTLSLLPLCMPLLSGANARGPCPTEEESAVLLPLLEIALPPAAVILIEVAANRKARGANLEACNPRPGSVYHASFRAGSSSPVNSHPDISCAIRLDNPLRRCWHWKSPCRFER